MSWLTAQVAEDCCLLTTVGRRSGRHHEIEIWFVVRDETMYVVSGNGVGADWYRNLLAQPLVYVQVGDQCVRGVARPVTDDDERRAVGDLLAAKYRWGGDPSIGLTYEAWCFEVPAVAIADWATV